MELLDGRSEREADLHDLLTQKDFELEERSRLLHKSKVTIEQLQDEIQLLRAESEQLSIRMRHKDELLSQREMELSRSRERSDADTLELECQRAENSAVQETLTSKIVELQRTKSEFHIFRTKAQEAQQRAAEAADRSESELAESNKRVATSEAALPKIRQEAEALRTRLKSLQLSLEDREAAMVSYKEKAEIAKRDRQLPEDEARYRKVTEECSHLRTELQTSNSMVKELARKSEALVSDKQAATEASREAEHRCEKLAEQLRDAETALAETQTALDRKVKHEAAAVALAAERAAETAENDRQWGEHMQSATARFEAAMEEAEKEWVGKVARLESQWVKKYACAESAWRREREEGEEQAKARVSEKEREWSAKHRELQAKMTRELEDSRRQMEAEVARTERGYDQHIREVQSRWQEEKIALERRWQQEKETTEERFQELMDDAQMGWRKEKDELNTKWQKRLEEAERGWSHERTSIAASWAARLEELEALAVRQQDALREELEERLGAVSARLHDMAVKESGRERLRQELTLQVEELRSAADEEYSRRVETEHSMAHTASSLKRALADKDEEVHNLEHEVSLIRDLSRSYHSSFDSAASPPRSRSPLRSPPRRNTSPPRPPPQKHFGSPLSHRFSSPAGSRDASPSMLADIESELMHLRQARESFQSTILREEEKRNQLLERISSKIKATPSTDRYSAAPAARSFPSSAPRPSVLSSSHFDDARAELSTRLGSAIRSLEPTLGTPSL